MHETETDLQSDTSFGLKPCDWYHIIGLKVLWTAPVKTISPLYIHKVEPLPVCTTHGHQMTPMTRFQITRSPDHPISNCGCATPRRRNAPIHWPWHDRVPARN